MIFDAFERMVAFRYLRARRKEGFISVIAGFSLLGIGLGVATLIVVMAVMNGFRQELLTRILGINGHMGVYGTGPALAQFDPLAQSIRGLPGVVRVIPTVEGQVMATSASSASGAIVRGVRPDDLLAREIFAKGLGGSGEEFKNGDGVLVGYRLAEKLGLQIGDTVTLISPKGNATAFGTVPRMRGYTVAGTFNVGMFEYDSGFMFMPLEAAQTYFKFPDAVTQIEVFLDNHDKVTETRNAIFRLTQGNVRIYDWQQANASFFNAVQVERNVMFLILTLIILVAAFNIISSLIMLVKDKGRDIAILRTMGATRGMIMRIFFLAGASVGVVGTVFGTILGVWFATHIEQIRQFIQSIIGRELFAAEIYFLTQLPARVEYGEVVVVVLMALGLSIAATIYPSWRAANLDPVEALRYE
ncbi:lipoprotein-releasing ABC transporter permease subunit [Magnetospirillum gryphiswaldense]|uniref:Lipoprotein releasing system, transmembrane protein, LolC/E family n=2 Tax=Magnetospirillum gryphiswaldense TaxID=55518 RepID=V6F228_MAGGM|nr:lipoprotein-releasing ABC transporter permease subunit [Magnetospirillum gryphiswaldense]AVM73652.1 Lipoprotein-releasing system transmembrane protein LolC [Magnetospirillum gryphiswaldense MSR-1]AVM77555.1 Lipoprotein-releasing system transmembrane protein LolC [Magnetospirillum gryphiswaldense]CAM76707.1 Lipoprotein releasing system, transmembrane protein, LolC/E family [Magnetospirillum gryphiswaldense MSR-1]CDK98326.1 putative Lipoprotein releasing system, transmembrane protein, LolC/E f